MTNYEKYKTKIDEIWEARENIAIRNGKVESCCGEVCEKCGFFGCGNCTIQRGKWLVAEYEEPTVDWSKVPMDTPILVRDRKSAGWLKRYFAKYENNKVYTWRYGCTSWSAESEKNAVPWEFAKLAGGRMGRK